MYTGRVFFFFSSSPFYETDMGDVKALINRLFGIEVGGRNFTFNIFTTEQKQHLKFLTRCIYLTIAKSPWKCLSVGRDHWFGSRMGNLENRATAERAPCHIATSSAGTGRSIDRDWASEQEKDDVFVCEWVCVVVFLFFYSYARVSVWVFVAGNGSVVRYEVFSTVWLWERA